MIKKTLINLLFATTSFFNLNSSLAADTKEISQTDVLVLIKATDTETVIVDVRTPNEFAKGHIPSAINIAHSAILDDPSLLAAYKDKNIVLYCHSGFRVGKVTNTLSKLTEKYGKTVYHLTGDYRAWSARGLTIEKPH